MSNVSEAEWNLRVDLAAAFHLAAANNLHEGITNHFSAVLPATSASNWVISSGILPHRNACWMRRSVFTANDLQFRT